MKNIKNKILSPIVISIILGASVVWMGGILWEKFNGARPQTDFVYSDTPFGDYLAMRHATWVDDYESVIKFSEKLQNITEKSVANDVAISKFLSGTFDDSAKSLSGDVSVAGRATYISYLLTKDDWRGIYKIVGNEKSLILSPLRIWSSVGIKKESYALKYIETMPVSDSWKLFARGMIYAETGRAAKAKVQFDKVPLDFFNLNDYLYLMSFYTQNNFQDAADDLRRDFTNTPGGAFLANYNDAGTGDYFGKKKALAFSIIQNISHSPLMSRTGAGLLLLRLADATYSANSDALNYYTGSYFYTSGATDYRPYFDKISRTSPYYPFVQLKYAEAEQNGHAKIRKIKKLLDKSPMFMPALSRLVDTDLQLGQGRDALKALNNTLGAGAIPNKIRAYLLQQRARIYTHTGDFNAAESDLLKAGDLMPEDIGIMLDIAHLWVSSSKKLDNAYSYAMVAIKENPSDVAAWDTMAMATWKREGVMAASDILERVGAITIGNSRIFQHLGDVRMEYKNREGAISAYKKAIELSGDGLSCGLKCLDKKLRNAKKI
ncbi:MAG: hypothetical protein LBL75_03310 [Rickettsiales bacterium]|jgi:tetratricopeptide (TPR) repeat protein|nr:hypothetical protein [Rickettsiales bacterium]